MQASKITYDGERLPILLADANDFIEQFHPIDSIAKAKAFKDEGLTMEFVQKEIDALGEYIKFRQGKADKLKQLIDACKDESEKENAINKLKKLCNGPTVGLIYLRECERKFNDLLKLCTDSEKIINRSGTPCGFKVKKENGGAQLLAILKAPHVAAPPPKVVEEECAAIEKSLDAAADLENAKLAELIEDDKRATEFEESPEEHIHDVVEEDMSMRINARKAEIVDTIAVKMREMTELQYELMRIHNGL
jgi:hypothetical protein